MKRTKGRSDDYWATDIVIKREREREREREWAATETVSYKDREREYWPYWPYCLVQDLTLETFWIVKPFPSVGDPRVYEWSVESEKRADSKWMQEQTHLNLVVTGCWPVCIGGNKTRNMLDSRTVEAHHDVLTTGWLQCTLHHLESVLSLDQSDTLFDVAISLCLCLSRQHGVFAHPGMLL